MRTKHYHRSFKNLQAGDDIAALDNWAGLSYGGSSGGIEAAINAQSMLEQRCYLFDGVNDYIQAPSNGIPTGNESWSMCAFIKPSGTAGDNAFLGWGTFDVSRMASLAFLVGNPGKLSLWGYSNDHYGTIDVPTGYWSHVAATYDGTTNRVRLYVNGILDIEATAGTDFNLGAGTNINIGQSVGGTARYNGRLTKPKIFNRELTPLEILQLANDNPVINGLAYAPKCNELEGIICNDHGPNSNDGTIYNAVASFFDTDYPFPDSEMSANLTCTSWYSLTLEGTLDDGTDPYDLTDYEVRFKNKDNGRFSLMLRREQVGGATQRGYLCQYAPGFDSTIRSFTGPDPLNGMATHFTQAPPIVPDSEDVRIRVTGENPVKIEWWMGSNVYHTATISTAGRMIPKGSVGWHVWVNNHKYSDFEIIPIPRYPVRRTWVTDNFNDTDNTFLADHTPDTNKGPGVWHDPNNRYKIVSNELVPNGSHSDDQYIDVGTKHYEVETTFNLASASGYDIGLRFRIDPNDTGRFLYAFVDESGGTHRVFIKRSYDWEWLAVETFLNPTAGDHVLRLECSDNNIKVYVDGYKYIDIDSDVYLGSTLVGLRQLSGDNYKTFLVYNTGETNAYHVARSLIRPEVQFYFKPNYGQELGEQQDITDYVVNQPQLSEQLTKSTESVGGVLLSSFNISLDNSRNKWDEGTHFFNNAVVNNSIIGILVKLIDGNGDPVYPWTKFEGLLKLSSSSWNPKSKRFRANIIDKLNLLQANKVSGGYIPNGNIKNTIYNMINRSIFTRYFDINLDDITLGWDIDGVIDNPSALTGKTHKENLDLLCYLSGSVYYLDHLKNKFVVEPVNPEDPEITYAFERDDILDVTELSYDWAGQANAFTWDDGTLDPQTVEMSQLTMQEYVYDYLHEKIESKFIQDTDNRNTIMYKVLELYQHRKKKVKFSTKYNPELQINKFITVNLPRETYQLDNRFIWNATKWNVKKKWSGETPGLYINSAVVWRITDVKKSTNGKKMIITAKQKGITPFDET